MIIRNLKLISLLLILACSSTPPSMYKGGHYAEKELTKDTYMVTFYGKEYIPEQQVLDMLYLRCSELALQRGFGYFKIVKDRTEWKSTTLTSGLIELDSYKEYQITNMVQFLLKPEPNVQNYDAYAIYHKHKNMLKESKK